MRKLFLFTFMVLSMVSVAFAQQGPWKFHRNYGDTNIYLSKDESTRLVVSYETTSKVIDLSKKEKFYRELEEDKKKVLSFTGVHDWKAKDYKLEEHGGVNVLTIDGTYVDSDDLLVHFHEVHFYAKGKVLQTLATSFQKKNLEKAVKGNSLSGFKVKYGLSY